MAYSKLRIDFEYIVELLQGVVDSLDLLQGFVDSLDQTENDFDEAEFETRIRTIGRQPLGKS